MEPEDDGIEPIAVVGIGCRFPGSATSPGGLWEMLANGESAWSEFPEDRMNMKAHYHPDSRRQGSTNVRGAHFLRQNIAVFDAPYFGISPDEAKAIDPQQRLLLEVALEALENAGLDRDGLKGSETGVFVGSFVKDYEQIALRDRDDQPQYSATGTASSILANRISYFLDIHGPSQTVDTGCSASLAAIHDACKSLLSRETDAVIAGGSGLILTPNTIFSMQALGLLGPDGKCFAFDERANGYGRGEGVGVVVLKRLKDAIRDNNCIRAVIRGTRANHDGKTAGLTQPNPKAQLQNIQKLYKRARLNPHETGYVECHGTGTQAGDVREVQGIYDSLCQGRATNEPLVVGSIKANVGHLEGAAGIAGLIKAILVVEKGIIPKQINYDKPNPAINFADKNIKVPTSNIEFPSHRQGLRRAGINSFGFGGSNYHIVIEDTRHYLSERSIHGQHNTSLTNNPQDPTMRKTEIFREPNVEGYAAFRRQLSPGIRHGYIPMQNTRLHLFIFSAHQKDSLQSNLIRLLEHIDKPECPNDSQFLENLAYTFGPCRTQLDWRISFTAASMDELKSQLATAAQGNIPPPVGRKASKVAFVFGGQGAQSHCMAHELMGFDIYAHSIAAASKFMQEKLGSDFSLIEELLAHEEYSRINSPEIAQPATTALQVALVDLLIKFCGVVPVSVVGHSSGEIAAAYACGYITRETAWELAYHRGKCAATLEQSTDDAEKPGRMMAVSLSEEAAGRFVDRVGRHRVAIACVNSPKSVTLSGDADAIMETKLLLDEDGIQTRLLNIHVGYHSHHMTRCADQYAKAIAHMQPESFHRTILPHPRNVSLDYLENHDEYKASGDFNRESTTMFSSALNRPVQWNELTPEYWVNNLKSPVQFFGAAQAMLQSDESTRPDIVVEIGPQSRLSSPLREIFEANKVLGRQPPLYYSMIHRDQDPAVTTFKTIGQLWTHHCPINREWATMPNVRPKRPSLVVDLPTYSWSHSITYWHESALSKDNRFADSGRRDLIGRLMTEDKTFAPSWRGFLRLNESPWIRQHQVQNTTIYPASGMIVMVVEAVKQISKRPTKGIKITDFKFVKPMLIPESTGELEYMLQMNIHHGYNGHPKNDGEQTKYNFSIYSVLQDREMEVHSHGTVSIYHWYDGGSMKALPEFENKKQLTPTSQEYQKTRQRCNEWVVPQHLYEALDVIGMNYGPLFQNVTSLDKNDTECTFDIQIPDTKTSMPANFEFPHTLHPATLDSIFQTAFSLRSEAMVPSHIGSIYITMGGDLPKTAGEEIVGFVKAVSQGAQKASVSIVASNDSWKNPQPAKFARISDPAIIVEDMELVALTSDSESGSEAGGFIPDHQNLCSEIKWEALDDADSSKVDTTIKPELIGSLFVLIPEDSDDRLARLAATLCQKFDCKSLTLSQIDKNQLGPVFCISLLEATKDHHFIWSWSEDEFTSFHKLISSTQGMLWLTQGATTDSMNPKSSLFQALARTIRSENPTKNLVTLDLDTETNLNAEQTLLTITSLATRCFYGPDRSESSETDYAEKNGKLMVPRLVPLASLNSLIMKSNTRPAEPAPESLVPHQSRPLKLIAREDGNLKSLYWVDDETAAQELDANSVAIKVVSAGLSVLDADSTVSRPRLDRLGTDVFGIIESVGAQVQNFTVGETVVGIARGSLRSQVRCDQSLVFPAGDEPLLVVLPTSLAVADYTLRSLAQLNDKKSILIHAGASSFRLEALKLASQIGAKVFVSVSGHTQRAFLMTQIGPHQAMILEENRDDLMACITSLTAGAGVNVIFDPTTSHADINMHCVANCGHIICIARNAMATGSLPPLDNKTFQTSFVNIDSLIENAPQRLGDGLKKQLNDGHCLHDCHLHDCSHLSRAFQEMMSDKHTGNIYCMPTKTEGKNLPVVARADQRLKHHVKANATYVIAGIGGLGRVIAELLASNGAKHIAVLSRSGAIRTSLSDAMTYLKNRGVNIKVYEADICDEQSLKNAVNDIKTTMPPVCGLFQCAAVLRDAPFEKMTYENWQTAIRPKTIGSWNLYKLFPASMDFMIFLSSASGIIGNRCQANYAAGNAFQDALAKTIAAKGNMRAVSLDLGPVLGAGMVAEDQQTLDLLKATGFLGIRLHHFLLMVERAIVGFAGVNEPLPPQVVAGADVPAEVVGSKAAGAGEGAAALIEPTATRLLLAEAKSREEGRRVIQDGLCAKIAAIMAIGAEEVDTGKSPADYGVDSFMRPVIRSWLLHECGAGISVLEIEGERSVAGLAALAAERSSLLVF
uniref:Polyketide synthase n=1 Tax=Pestalotiopsis microspora TaxID=85828 RepID=A0A1P8NTK4_PESMI|nr:polyketide synthase [Pestalotiopsis microspora]